MRRLISLLTLATFFGGMLAPATAQEPGSRAEEQARQQQEKATRLTPYRAPWIERQLLAIEEAGGFGVARGVFVTFGDIKRGSGIALGPAYAKAFASGASVIGKAAFSVRGFKMGQVALQAPAIGGGRLLFRGRARWQDAPTVRLYALGPDSPKNATDYAETKTEFSGEAVLRPVRLLRFGAGAGIERFDTGVSRKADPANPLFLNMPGANADPRYVHARAFGAIDSRDGLGYSRHGTMLQAVFHDFRQQDDGPFSFQRVDGAVEQYVPILHGNWVLFLGARASTTTTESGREVPFFLMPDLGGHDLRGFDNYRFRDRHSIMLTAEYRWYAQEFLDAAIFYDAGKAVPDRRSLDFDGLKSSIGAGIRFHGPQTTALRLEVARSREGLRLIFAFSAVGQ
jgi:hypothetical protein